MAIPILNHMDFGIGTNKAEIRNVRIHNVAEGSVSNPGVGQIIYDSGTLKYYNGSAFVSLGTSNATGDITGVDISVGTGLDISQTNTASGDYSSTITIDISEFSAVTPASGDSFLTLDSDGATEQLTTVSALQTYMQNNLTFTTDTNLTEEEVEDFVGGMVTGNTETGITVTYQDADGTLDFVVADSDFALTGDVTGSATQTAKGNVSIATTIASGAVHHGMLNDDIISGQGALTSGLASTDELMISDAGTVKRMDVSVLQSYLQSNLTFTSNTDVDVSNANLLTRLANLESSGGASNENITIGADSGDTIVITGNLQVSGTTTTVNSTTVNLNDHNIVLDSGNSTSAVVDGAGITLEGGSGDDATFTYNASTNAFDFKLGSAFEDIKAAKFTGTELDISGDADIDGTLEADAITVDGTTLTEFIQDTVGAMVTGNTETRVAVTYEDGDGTLDFVVDDMTANTQLTTEEVQDIVGAMFSGNTETNITATYQDSDGTIDLVSTNTQLSLASAAEVQTGTNATKAVTPDTLAAKSVHATIDVSDSTFASNLYAEITHSLGTEDVIVQLFDSSSKETVFADVARTDKSNSASTSKVKITFAAAPSNDIEVLITSIKGSTAGTVSYS
tara:strand:- start:409 stop:2277 length:1869 start_codon:yes stop_codon:yes gene_type:complete